MSGAYYIGAVTAPAPDAAQYFDDPASHVDKRWGAEAKAKRIGEIEEERQEKSRLLSMTGRLASIYVVDGDGKPVYGSKPLKDPGLGKVAIPFVNWLLQTLPGQFSSSLRYGETEAQAVLFGFDIKEIFKLSAFELLAYNLTQPPVLRLPVPVRLWYSPLGVYDPMDLLLTGEERKSLDLRSVLKFFQVEPGDMTTAMGRADLAKTLADITQLTGLVNG